jgi:predicted DNA-binding transcriptional regulator YafY
LCSQDAADRLWHFTIRHACIVPRDECQYLDCWCEETDGNQDIPELAHNRTLRLDRILDAAISSIQGAWRKDLDAIEVEMHLYGGLAFAYHSKKPRDVSVDWLTEPTQVRRVVRQVTITFWFIREILRYGGDCEIIGPESVRERVRSQVQTLYQRYQSG